MVHWKEGASFIKSIDDSTNAHTAHTGEFIFNWKQNCIKEIREKCVLQLATNNHLSNMAVKNKLKESHPNIYLEQMCSLHNWPYAGVYRKTSKYKSVIEKARVLSVFLYAHHNTFALIHPFINGRDLVGRGLSNLPPPSLVWVVSYHNWLLWSLQSNGMRTDSQKQRSESPLKLQSILISFGERWENFWIYTHLCLNC